MVQAKLEQLQADSESSLAALRLEAQGQIAEAQQQANDRSSLLPEHPLWTFVLYLDFI